MVLFGFLLAALARKFVERRLTEPPYIRRSHCDMDDDGIAEAESTTKPRRGNCSRIRRSGAAGAMPPNHSGPFRPHFSTEPRMDSPDDVLDILNKLIATLLPQINAEISDYIVDGGMDPWKTVLSKEEEIGKIDLGICTAKVEAEFAVENMKGLGSFEITSMSVQSASGTTDVTGMLTVSAKVNSNLSGTVSGKVSGKCGILHESVEISGTLKASIVVASATAQYAVTIGPEQGCLTGVTLAGLSINAGKIEVGIKGLGLFGKLLEPLAEIVVDEFKSGLTKIVAAAVMPVLNKALTKVLPICVKAGAHA